MADRFLSKGENTTPRGSFFGKEITLINLIKGVHIVFSRLACANLCCLHAPCGLCYYCSVGLREDTPLHGKRVVHEHL